MIDTTKEDALIDALKNCNGRPIINSVNASDESLKKIFPIAKRYGALVVGITLDHKKIPDSAKERVKLAQKIIDFGKDYVDKSDIIIDPIIATISAEQERAKNTLEAVKMIKELGVKVNLGVSNVSHGLPNRSALNASFLSMAILNGLDFAIINPYEKQVMDAFYSSLALSGRDLKMKRYVSSMKDFVKKENYDTMLLKDRIINCVLNGDSGNIENYVKDGIEKYGPIKVNEYLIYGINEVGEMFSKKDIFLPQLMESAKAMKKGFILVKEKLPKQEKKSKGKVLFATVKGDIHDIGKNIVITMLETENFDVFDLGVDVSFDDLKKAIKVHRPSIICLSALMTTTVEEMKNIVHRLRDEGYKIPIMIGGAVVNQEYADSIKTGYAKDSVAALKKIHKLLS
jgi:5-methyltetrahydrofolate--homocysteine methyltransferase